jgi:hypothetical protein
MAKKMAYDVFASPVPVPEERRSTMIGIHFDNKIEALERVETLRRAGWLVYRVSGPGGFEMTENLINQFINSLSRTVPTD